VTVRDPGRTARDAFQTRGLRFEGRSVGELERLRNDADIELKETGRQCATTDRASGFRSSRPPDSYACSGCSCGHRAEVRRKKSFKSALNLCKMTLPTTSGEY